GRTAATGRPGRHRARGRRPGAFRGSDAAQPGRQAGGVSALRRHAARLSPAARRSAAAARAGARRFPPRRAALRRRASGAPALRPLHAGDDRDHPRALPAAVALPGVLVVRPPAARRGELVMSGSARHIGPFDAAAAAERTSVAARAAAYPLPRDWWPFGILAANLMQALAAAGLYPGHRLDPDLLAYLPYFHNWASGDATLHSAAYFTAPKLLLVFTLGALGNPGAAFACTAAVSALLGLVVYLLARD